MAIIDKINWRALDSQVNKQQLNRETYSPVISLYRWWARRPHAVAGAILDGASIEFSSKSLVVADPFSGGGTVAFEAVRRGHNVYAQDLYPWPSLALAAALTPADAKMLDMVCQRLLQKLELFREWYYCGRSARAAEITHVIRVRFAPCAHCNKSIYLFRDPFVSRASRKSKERNSFFGCAACGGVSLRSAGISRFKCDTCSHYVNNVSTLRRGAVQMVSCPHCNGESQLSILLDRPPAWKAVLVQDRCLIGSQKSVHLRPVRRGDPIIDVHSSVEESALRLRIPDGVETRHLLRSGFRYWGDVYTHRQAQTLLAAIREVEALDCPNSIKAKLRFAVLGACEMPGYLCRWGRTHPKTFEAIANHRFSRSTVVTETNLMSPVGRGTLPRRLAAMQKGVKWLQDGTLPRCVKVATSFCNRRVLTQGILVATGDSTRQLLQDGSAQLVLTDPPYHDDIQYGELSRLFHAWLSVAVGVPTPDEGMEAVPNHVRGTDTLQYEDRIKACLCESRRTLAQDGRLVLTFHNNRLIAWTALRNALRGANFTVVGLATVSAENGSDHSKRNKKVFLCDLVIECVLNSNSRNKPGSRIAVRGRIDTEERRNLVAIGIALGKTVNGRSLADLDSLYQRNLRRMGETNRLIR